MSELKAGRELDALVAHRVMGWTVSSVSSDPHRKEHWISGIRAPDGVGGIELDPPDWRATYHLSSLSEEAVPFFSTDIAAAWTVVQKMRELGFAFEIGSRFDDEDGEVASETDSYAQFARTQEELMTTAEYGVGAAPLAICLAALKAVGGAA